jgi:hypothetical protein
LYGAGLVASLALLGLGSIKPFSLLAVGGDNLFTLTFIKTYVNGGGFRINPNLGFPGVQDNLFFPTFDFSSLAFLRAVSHFASGVAAPYYLYYLCGSAAVFIACAYALRSLGFQNLLTVIGAVVYVVSPYLFLRAYAHDFLALYFSAPLGAALALHLWGDHAPPLSRAGLGASLAIVATSGLYYAFFSALFMCFVGAVASLSRRTWRPFILAVLAACAILLVLAVTGFGTGIVDVISGRVRMVQRFAFEQLRYGLYLPDAMSLFKDMPFFGRGFTEYLAIMPQIWNTTGLFEWPGLLLTLVIFGSALIVPVVGASGVAMTRWSELVYISAACIVFGLLYSISGGLGYFFNMFLAPSIRATARVMPFLTFFALVVVLASVELLIANKARVSRVGAVALMTLLVGCMVPSVNALATKHRQLMSSTRLADLQSVHQILAAKDASGVSKVLQLPAVQWPEAANIGNFSPYEHQLYFIFDREGSQTKWSYGAAPDQPAYFETKAVVDKAIASGLAPAARRLQFDGLIIEKRAYDATAIDGLKANVEADGALKLFEDETRVFYSLVPLNPVAVR